MQKFDILSLITIAITYTSGQLFCAENKDVRITRMITIALHFYHSSHLINKTQTSHKSVEHLLEQASDFTPNGPLTSLPEYGLNKLQ